MKYKKPKVASLYGLPVYYRIEMRKGRETLILSFRQDTKTKISYEAPPVRVDNWEKMTSNCWSKEIPGCLLLEALSDKTKAIERFCEGFVGLDTGTTRTKSQEAIQKALKLRREHRCYPPLPLGILLLADRKVYINSRKDLESAPGKSTVEDRMKAIRLLAQHEGYTPLKAVTPKKCANWLDRLSAHDRMSVARLLHHLFAVQISLEPGLDDPWASYHPTEEKKKKSQDWLIEQHNERVSLTDGQCAEIFQICTKHILDGTPNATEFAVLLLMTVLITPEELCALTYQDFTYLRDYRFRLVLRVINHYVKAHGKKNYQLKRLESKYKERYIPLAFLAAAYYEALLVKEAKQPNNGIQKPSKSLIVFHASNKERRLQPKDLEANVLQYMMPWMPKSISGAKEKKFRPASAVQLLQRTAEQHMEQIGYEKEEMRRMRGLAPQLVSAKSYQDFLNESELNKLGALTDRWIQLAFPDLSKVIQANRDTKKKELLLPDAPNGRTEATIRIEIPPIDRTKIPKEGVAITLSAHTGITGTIKHIPRTE